MYSVSNWADHRHRFLGEESGLQRQELPAAAVGHRRAVTISQPHSQLPEGRHLRDLCVWSRKYSSPNPDPETIKNLEIWTQLFKEHHAPNTVAALCGNKQDLEPYLTIWFRNFDQKRLREFQSRHNMPFFQVSACTGAGINEMFFCVVDLIGELITKTKKEDQGVPSL